MAKKDIKPEIKETESASSLLIQKFKTNPLLYIGSVIILVLVTVTFVGGNVIFRAGAGDADFTFGYYDKVPITWVPGNMFANNQKRVADYYQSRGFDINNYYTLAQIWRQAFELTVEHKAILQVMKRSNYSAPEKTVNREVARLPVFQENGQFSSALFNKMPESSRLTLLKEINEEYTKTVFYNDFYYGMITPQAEADFIGKMSSNMRTFEMAALNIEDYPETEYQAYAYANAGLFRTIHLSKITVFSSEREARKILDSIKNGTMTFEDAARAQSQDNFSDRGGDMGSRYYYDLQSEFPNSSDRELVFSLSRGEISDVFKIGDGWTFFRIEEQIKSADFNDELTMERVRSYVKNSNRGLMDDWAIAQAREFILEAVDSGFDNAARWRSLKTSTFGPLPLNYGGVDLFPSLESFQESFAVYGLTAQDITNLSGNENFWRIAFSTKLNTPSEPLVQGSKVLVLLPIEQTEDEDNRNDITSSYYYWLMNKKDQAIRYFFLNNNPRMDDKFWDTFFRYFKP
jgi:hypothetical protein